MNTRRFPLWARLLLVVLLVGTLAALAVYFANLPENLSQHETLVLGQNRWAPGSEALVHVLVRDSSNGSPLANAQVEAQLKPAGGQVFSATTDAQGSAVVRVQVPADAAPEQTLVVRTRSALGADEVEQKISVERDYRLFLSTDKPIYQPGQVIHLRALALSAFDLSPADGQEVEVIIADGKGNKVFRQKIDTSEYGAVWTDFQLASEVNTGDYKISAVMGDTTSEKTVSVEHYALPKFEVTLDTERDYYTPGSVVRGTLEARYFFGKPVANSPVHLEGATFDVQRNLEVTLDGQTDAEGRYTFEFALPGYIAGSDLDNGLGTFYVQAAVTDQTQHSEISNLSLPVAARALVIEAVPESGVLKPGVENLLYVMTSYPDGSPADCDLVLTLNNGGTVMDAQTGEFGVAELRFTPTDPYQAVQINANDSAGNRASANFSFSGTWEEESVLLRPDQPVYRVGDTMNLTVLTTARQGSVYLDIVREGQTVSTRSLEIQDGRADAAVDLTPDLFGTLELHAYKILSSGSIVRDSRLVAVENRADLAVSFAAGQETYLPGDTASLDLRVQAADTQGVQAAVGLAIVDESVFALAEQDPGFAKLYFLLESQLLEPKYDLHGFSVPDLMIGVPSNNPDFKRALARTGQAAMAAAVPTGQAFSLQVDTRTEHMQQANTLRTRFFNGFSLALFGGWILLALAVAFFNGRRLVREGRFGRAILVLGGTLLGLGLISLIIPLGENDRWVSTYWQRLEVIIEALLNQANLVALGILALIGLIGLIVAAARSKDVDLGWLLGGAALSFGILVLLSLSLQFIDLNTGDAWVTVLLITAAVVLLLYPLSFLLRAAGFLLERRGWASFGALTVGLALLVVSLPLGAITMMGGGGAMAPAMVEQKVNRDMVGAIPPMMAPMATQAPMVEEAAPAGTAENTTGSAQEAPRLRQYFPETMLWLPDAVTDANGDLHLDVPVADSITTWRMTALASSKDGRMGSISTPLVVFQDFFIDLDLPAALTVGDEVAVPVGVYNYLTEEQTVRLELQAEDWFELVGEGSQEISLQPNEINVVYFRVRALDFGPQSFQVTAWGSKMSDAIRKPVTVYPNGKLISATASDRLEADLPADQAVFIPNEAVAGTQKLLVKIYPGMVSQVVEGLDSILQMPSGCFEQTSSTTYPNVLVLDYLKNTQQLAPEVQMKAEEYINLGYQRLLTFEVAGGGFSLFGDAPADRMLTAYGLQEFSDMSRVHSVDEALIQRTADWLLAQQESDGSWKNDRGLVHEGSWAALGDDRTPVTAYIVWSLISAGQFDDAGVQKGLEYVREHATQMDDPYALALVTNALVAADRERGDTLSSATQAALDRLAGMAQRSGSQAFWSSQVATFMGGEGQTGSVETTALAAYAMLRARYDPQLSTAALTYLIQTKDNAGTWYTTQATVLALKALIESVSAGGEGANATLTVTLNGGQERTLEVTPETFDVVQMVSFEDVLPGAENHIAIQMQGQGNLMYQVVSSYYLPWDKLAQYPELQPQQELVSIDVAYDRTELAVNDTVTVNVTVNLNQPGGKAESALIDLGLPPGFTVMSEDLDAWVARFNDVPEDYDFPAIQRYELTGRQILVYITNLQEGKPLEFSYRLLARFPLQAQTPSSSAYDYYNPDVNGLDDPQTLVVNP
ncbi:large extracellular alpha-helical protein [Longilinea arvoryzae]|uniref:Large extracellular alpha-helical protein n=1 Tax=Longilinea arvoryzae TaxID=360412 RepID=A0A0S7BGW0_9CHLR|nr:MG2 domain-containing protein [Longilinea arvoryzae]GAP13432.1 large extracellular alpha-helical protein [Longilinea arvoryzae]